MPAFVQYHNADLEGTAVDAGVLSGRRNLGGIRTARRWAPRMVGGQMFVIMGLGRPRRFYLSASFQVDRVVDHGTWFDASGPGRGLCPPVRLWGPEFESFRRQCANFVGCTRIDSFDYAQTLRRLARHSDGRAAHQAGFLRQALWALPGRHPAAAELARLLAQCCPLVDLRQSGPTRALSICQPYVEGILLGHKTVEYRSQPTRVRGPVYLYASRTRPPQEAESLAELRADYCTLDDLPRGLLLGTVEIVDCTPGGGGYLWHLRHPRALLRPLRPRGRPQPRFFRPF